MEGGNDEGEGGVVRWVCIQVCVEVPGVNPQGWGSGLKTTDKDRKSLQGREWMIIIEGGVCLSDTCSPTHICF